MSDSPKLPRRILVGIATKDRANLLRKAISSTLAQRGVQIRVSVIDDGSQDGTKELPQEFPSVEWIRREKDEGYLAARNYWVKNAVEDYFVSLDDDAWFLSGDEVVQAATVMDQDAEIGAIAFDILSPDKPEPHPRTRREQTSSFIGCGHMLRLSAVREVGAYEEFPGSYGVEEKDLCLRLLDASYKIVRLNGVHVWHDKTSIARERAAQLQSGVCNDLVMAIRRTPTLLLPAAIMSKLFRHLFWGLKHHSLRPVWDGIRLFVRELPRVWRSRRPVKASTLRTFMQLRSR